jgi:hypothetical protein
MVKTPSAKLVEFFFFVASGCLTIQHLLRRTRVRHELLFSNSQH